MRRALPLEYTAETILIFFHTDSGLILRRPRKRDMPDHSPKIRKAFHIHPAMAWRDHSLFGIDILA